MGRIVFANSGRYGIIKDRQSHTLPLEAWSDGNNVRFVENSVQRTTGETRVWTPTIDPWWLLHTTNAGEQQFWVYAGADKIYVVDQDNVHTDISGASQPYGSNFNLGWNGGVMNGLVVANNGGKRPQLWNPATPSVACVDLTNWPATWTARVIRPFKEFLVALDITKGGVRYPYNVLWSHPAEPGSIPSTWDTTDPTNDAGEKPMSDSGGFVTDLMPLRDVAIIYRRDQTWGLQYVGGASVMRLYRITKFGGVYSRNCVQAFMQNGEKHFVVTAGDVIVHDGQTANSVIETRMRRWLFNQVASSSFQRLHVAHNHARKEMWICIPVSFDQATRALIWNYVEDKWSIRDLPHINYAEAGQVNPNGVLNWDSDSATWNTDQSAWDEEPFPPHTDRLLLAVPGSTRGLLLADDSNQFQGVNYTSFVERTGLAVVGQDAEGNPIFDLATVKLVTEVWPRVDAPLGAQIDVQIGTQSDVNDAVTWTPAFPYIVGRDKKVNPLVSGKLLSVRFSMSGDFFCRLHGYDLVIQPIGAF
jgi:hypothetical protein